MESHTIEISPDGTTQITVRGLKGKACKKATELIEAALGKTIKDTSTPEMHETVIVKRNA